MYDPKLGRFIAEDPIGFDGGDINLYAYVWNDPVTFSDPSGLSGKNKKLPKKIPTSGTLPGTNIPYRMDLRQQPHPNMHVWWSSTAETVISHRGGWLLDHGGKPTVAPPSSYRKNLRPVVCEFLRKVRLGRGMGGVLSIVGISGGLITDYEIYRDAERNNTSFEAEMCERYGDAGPYIHTVIGMLPNPYQGCIVT